MGELAVKGIWRRLRLPARMTPRWSSGATPWSIASGPSIMMPGSSLYWHQGCAPTPSFWH